MKERCYGDGWCEECQAYMAPEQGRFWRRVDKTSSRTGCWLWTGGLHDFGYGKFWHNGRDVGAHRFSWEIARGPVPPEMCVCHNCPGGDNPRCVNPDHLWLGTSAQNNTDRNAKGRSRYVRPRNQACGERVNTARLSGDDVLVIRARRAAGASISALAREYRVSRPMKRLSSSAPWPSLASQRRAWRAYAGRSPCSRGSRPGPRRHHASSL